MRSAIEWSTIRLLPSFDSTQHDAPDVLDQQQAQDEGGCTKQLADSLYKTPL
jgi:hypothetical protein